MDDHDILIKLYDENCNHSRHHENLRATMSNLIILVGTGLLGLVTIDQHITKTALPLTLFLTLLGIFGALFSAKHYERLRLHRGRAHAILAELNKRFPSAHIQQLMQQADEANKTTFPLLSQWKLNHFWTLLHALIALIGLVVSIGIIAGVM